MPCITAQQSLRDCWIELSAAAPDDFCANLRFGQRPPVRPFAGHGVDRIRKRNDSGGQRYALAGESVGIASSIPILVVVPD